MIWVTLALVVASFLITAFLTPKPDIENAKPAKLGDFRFPRIDEGVPVPIFWGRVRLRGPTVLWYGDLEVIPIEDEIKTGLFSSKKVIVGYRYLIGVHLALALSTGTGTKFLRIWAEEKEIWSGDQTAASAGSAISVSAPGALGGREEGGGFVGTARVYPGDFSHTQNAYLAGLSDIDAAELPHYKGLVHVVMEHMEIGEQPNIKPFNFEIENVGFSPLGLGNLPNGDANPAEVLFDILTNSWGRLGLSTDAIDTTSFSDAGTVLASESHGISLAVQSSNDARDVIEEVLKQIDGLIYEDPETQKIKLVLTRFDYDVDLIPSFDESNVIEIVNFAASSWGETSNQVRIIYNDRDSDYTEKTAIAQDMANVGFNSRVKGADFNYRGVSNADLANHLAARHLNMLSIPLIKVRLITNRDGATLRPGDVIKLAWDDYGISQLVLRVQKFDVGELDDGRVALDLIQDRFAVSETVYASPPATAFVPPVVAAAAITVRQSYEMPRFLANKLVAAGAASSSEATADNSFVQHLALSPQSLALFFSAQNSEDVGVTYGEDISNAEFAVSALLDADYAIDTDEYDTSTGITIKQLTNSGVLSSPPGTAANGGRLILIGNEILCYENYTDNMDGTYDLTNVWRGVLDTSPRAHSEDDRVWFLSPAGLDNLGETDYVGTEALKIRLITKTGLSNLDPDDASVDDLQLAERGLCPYPPDELTIEGVAYPTTVVDGVDTTIDLAWKRRDRTITDTVTRPDASDETPEGGTTYLAKWTVDGGSENTQAMGSGTSYSLDLGSYGDIELQVVAVLDSRESLFPVTRSFTFSAS